MEVKLQIFVEGIMCAESRVIYPEEFEEIDFKERVEAKEKFVLQQTEKLKSFYKIDNKTYEVFLSILCDDLGIEGEEYAELQNVDSYLKEVKVYDEIREVVFRGTVLSAAMYLRVSKDKIIELVNKKSFYGGYSVRYQRAEM